MVSYNSLRPLKLGCSLQGLGMKPREQRRLQQLLGADEAAARRRPHRGALYDFIVLPSCWLRLQAGLGAVDKAAAHRALCACSWRACASEQCLRMPSRVSKLGFGPLRLGSFFKSSQPRRLCRLCVKTHHARPCTGLSASYLAVAKRRMSPGHAPARWPQPSPHRPRARAADRPSCATSSECVRRARNKSPSWLRNTCVL